MSKSRGCVVVRWTDKQWYCITAHDEHDYEFEDFTITGPFHSKDRAWNGHDGCNPGSLSTVKCRVQKDLAPSHLVKAMRKYIRNGNKNPSFKSKLTVISRRNW
jgi:hypothetical protein